jgi:hypothetical protein
MPSRQTLIILAVATAYVAVFGVLFGSPLGILGDLVHSIDPTTKSQLINSLAVFGFSCTGIAIWIAVAKPENPSSVVGVMAFLLWISASYGFMSIDCAVFNFCGRSDQNAKPACEVSYDKQGAHADCE